MPRSDGLDRRALLFVVISWFAVACNSQSVEIVGTAGSVARDDSDVLFDTSIEGAPGDSTPPDDDTAEQQPVQPDLFQADRTWAFSLQVEDDAWDELERDGRNYVPAVLEWETTQIDVQIHIKGSSSWQSINDKPALVVDINRVDPQQEFMQVKKFYLQNDCYDPSMMSSTLSYQYYREWGYPASQTSFATLAVNGRDYGLYVVLEAHNDDFLESWFGDPNGNLYENAEAYCDVTDLACMEIEEYDEGNHAAFEQLGQAALTRPDEWLAAIQGAVDYQRLVEAFALEMSLVHWDSYSYDLSNYQLYHEPTTDKFTLLTQSMDLDYGFRPWSYPNCGQYGMDLDNYDMGLLASGCIRDPVCHDAVVEAVERYAGLLELAGGADRVRALDERIGDAVRADPKRYYSNNDYERHVACLQTFFDERPGQLREWVAQQR